MEITNHVVYTNMIERQVYFFSENEIKAKVYIVSVQKIGHFM